MRYKYALRGDSVSKNLIAEAEVAPQTDVTRYTDWLTTNTGQHSSESIIEKRSSYSQEALKPVIVRGQQVIPFAPYQKELSARQTVTSKQLLFVGIVGLLWATGLILFGVKMLAITFAVIVVFYFVALLLNFFLSALTLNRSCEEQVEDSTVRALAHVNWPTYTILCPLYHEKEIVPQFVQAMLALDYPTEKLEILLLTEDDDIETRSSLRRMNLPRHFKIVRVPSGEPRTKPRACNFGLLNASGEYIVIYDAEDVPDPLQLKKAILTFANHDSDLVCVQAKLNYYNMKQNLLTRWFTAEYSLWFDLILPGMQQTRLPLPLGGTSNHFRMETLRALGAWDAFNVTEDCDLGLRLARSHYKTVVLDSTTYEEANSHVKNWLRQRSRWIKGYMQTYLVHMRLPLYYLQRGRMREFLSLQLIIGGKTAVLFINPIMWILLLIYVLFRPVDLYHVLFPAPVLYMGTLCFIFGNFFYAYTHLISCLNRGQFNLVRWTLLIPIYWMMISTAAFIALFQLIFKPHYWEKTQHGLHLSASQLAQNAVDPDMTQEVKLGATAATTQPTQPTTPLPTVMQPVAIKRVVLPHTEPLVTHQRKRRSWRLLPQDPWLVAMFVIACIASVGSCWYFFQHHDILLYGDAISHLRIARRVVDNTTPGLAQLGGVWLPLPHLLMLPFIWNYYLWRTGLAGSFVGLFSYLVASVYLFLAARRLTHDSRASFVGTLLFLLNPNVLYLQSTPLDEMVCVATAVMTCYYFLAWTQDGHPKYLAAMAVSCFLTTLARYDGWGLFPALFVLIMVVGWIKRQHWNQIEANLVVFATLGGLGIALWFLWCAIIFGDPLYFHDYLFGSGSAANGQFYTYHNVLVSIWTYLVLSIKTVGPILFALALLAFLVFAFRLLRAPLQQGPALFGAIAFLTPFVFYMIVFYTGQDTVYIPGIGPANTPHYFWNVRFGVETVAPVALFVSLLAARWSFTRLARVGSVIMQIALVIVICVQTLLITSGGIISLQDGMYGASCEPTEQITIYLARHYTLGDKVLEDVNAFPVNEADIGMNLKDAIYEGSGPLWTQALKHPASVVQWIIVPTKLNSDLIASHIDLNNPTFRSQFSLVVQDGDGLSLFHRNGLPLIPARAVPSSLLTEHSRCGT